MQHRPRKRFGQNFLQSPQIIAAILRAFEPKADDHVVEIGPGQGALTKPLLKHLNSLTAIEIDKDLQAYLWTLPNASERLQLMDADALTIDYSQFGKSVRVIGNLPYNISTPLILHLLHFASHLQDMLFMLQKEVVERLAASPGCKDYGRLSVIVQYYCKVEHLFNVPADVFFPKPKVESAIVHLTPHRISPYPEVEFHQLERLLAQAFSMRRKTLANNLKPLLNSSEISALGIDPKLRPEQLSIAEYVQIAKFVTK
ncbi:16S rRNA (adenine(1518)-N(6)/adenine(1519)-N(6))-dimethyltransferase RsmA [Legionella oakridgensis]|uniref:Ribosomal RNA small subunit methyltransferase A n=2 Tax=Legionella oakridgensis TaxID=29423 RepID=W0BES9_9GAMM|nr:16S rRNA (adenine(1518)-N(6)/adenine(1519)-N(6))-dimethyltransferase RsmA [Legionella oakridgensis]AHE68360.1 dimethyladenosine transferase [Legionella oakridgensis ATCC 33761 = DSM 21215]ETO92169.1 dimethyladenosine transferase [Legionella oakridgensis RV-2-2007]KTD38970.1 dimethyladenosine transferase (16S rRNA dimethylase) [Legionella oakridgensis]STY21302.1 dimethyladenosine transferase (16S rRNA dimethylase) [Legionella longbeachae]